MDSAIQLRVSDLVYAIRKHWKTIVVFTVVGLILGIAASGVEYLQGSMSRNYRITATAFVLPESEAGTYNERLEYPTYNDYLMAEEMADAAVYILSSNRLYNTVLAKSNLVGVKASDIKSNLQITRQGDTPVLLFTLTWRSSDEGVRIMSSILSNGSEVIRDTMDTGKLSVIDQPASRRVIGGGMAAPLWGIVMILGFCVGVGIVILNMLLRPKLINLNDIPVETGLETLGVISKDDDYYKSDESIMDREVKSKIRQQFSSAAYIVMNRLGKKKNHHVLYVTSATRREGRTSVAAHLAVHMAATEKKVLLIDFDNQNPELGKLFLPQVDYEHSLNALYEGDIEKSEAVVHINGYLDLMPMVLGMNIVPLDRSTFDLIDEIVDDYEYVIIDAPPVGESSETLSLNQIADTTIVVMGFDMATKMDIRSCIDKIDQSGGLILGAIVNQEQGMEGTAFVDRNMRNARANRVQSEEENMAQGILKNNKYSRTSEEKSISNQLMEETFGGHEEKKDDSEILEKLIKFGLDENDTGGGTGDNSTGDGGTK